MLIARVGASPSRAEGAVPRACSTPRSCTTSCDSSSRNCDRDNRRFTLAGMIADTHHASDEPAPRDAASLLPGRVTATPATICRAPSRICGGYQKAVATGDLDWPDHYINCNIRGSHVAKRPCSSHNQHRIHGGQRSPENYVSGTRTMATKSYVAPRFREQWDGHIPIES